MINTTITSDTYANSYSEIVGKYLISSSPSVNGNSTATLKSGTNLSSIYYVVSATATSFIYKQITSNRGTTEAVLAGTNDDYGGSYYFRGAVKNNYVKFANKCWRIVRITGNGAIKLVLHNDNTSSAKILAVVQIILLLQHLLDTLELHTKASLMTVQIIMRMLDLCMEQLILVRHLLILIKVQL